MSITSETYRMRTHHQSWQCQHQAGASVHLPQQAVAGAAHIAGSNTDIEQQSASTDMYIGLSNLV